MTFRELYRSLLDALPGAESRTIEVAIVETPAGPAPRYTAHWVRDGRRQCVFQRETAEAMLADVRAEDAADARRIDALGEAA